MRIALAELAQESDSFSPLRTGLPEFETYGLYFANEILERMPGAGPVGRFLDAAAERAGSVEIVPLVRAWASAGGPILDAAFETLRTKLARRLRACARDANYSLPR